MADVGAIKQDCALLDIVKPQEQVGQSGFPGARVSHHRDGLARLNCEAHAIDYAMIVVVGKTYVAKLDQVGGRG